MEALAKANGIPTKFDHPYVPTLVNTGKELVLFDTGNPKAGCRPRASWWRTLAWPATSPSRSTWSSSPTATRTTSAASSARSGKPTYPNARYVFGEVEFDFWRKGENVREARKTNLEMFRKVALPLGDKATFLKPDGEVVPGIRAVNAYGHSPGMLAFHVESDGRRLLVWGDVANQYVVSIQQPEWGTGFDDVKDAAIATRKRVLDMVATDKIPVAGFHMPFPSLGWVERSGTSYRWVPATYQFNL